MVKRRHAGAGNDAHGTNEFTMADRQHGRIVMMRTVILSTPRSLLSAISAVLIIALTVDHALRQEGSQDRWPVWLWCFGLSLALARGAWIATQFRRRAQSTGAVLATSRRLIVNGILCSIGWGISSWLLLPAPTLQAEAAVLLVIAMVVVGGAGTQAIHRNYLRAFVIVTVVIFASGLFRLEGQFHFMVGAGFIVLAFAMLFYGITQEHAVLDTILLGLRAERLLAEMTVHRQDAERARQEADVARRQAELANQAKNTFLAAAGHDLRQPMHALVQYLGVLQRHNRDVALDSTIARAGKSLDAMQDLLDSVLEVSRLMLGAVQPVVGVHRIADILDRVDTQMRPMAQDKGLQLTVQAPADALVHTDGVLLERMLRNLVLNALRYTAQGGVVLRAVQRGTGTAIQVFDSGIGIGRHEQTRIFEPFYQLGNTARDRHKGMGLGLAIVAQLGELLQVPVRVRSRPGRGSVFTLTLPLDHTAVAMTPVAAAPPPVDDYLHGACVVLIDDNADSLEATAATLAALGCRVLQARSGPDAVACLQAQTLSPQIVIADYRLEHGETGPQAIALVIEHQQSQLGERFAICALVLSGETAPAELAHVQQAGLALLHKPVKPATLRDAVNSLLRGLALDDRGHVPAHHADDGGRRDDGRSPPD